MFGWFKPRMAPEGPVEIEMDAEIERPADEVYALVDFGDPRNYKAEVGTITRTGAKSFDMVLDMLPDLTFPITEIEAEPGRSYTIESVLPEEVGGKLCKTVERCEIEPLGENSCKVTTTTLATFHPMKLRHFDGEVAMLAMACNNSLMKLKIHAEQGVETIREIEVCQIA
jgi:hypothetical protein